MNPFKTMYRDIMKLHADYDRLREPWRFIFCLFLLAPCCLFPIPIYGPIWSITYFFVVVGSRWWYLVKCNRDNKKKLLELCDLEAKHTPLVGSRGKYVPNISPSSTNEDDLGT